jgi:endogenous inhibitor of DNA gyrase (YacG/DUF329 family)
MPGEDKRSEGRTADDEPGLALEQGQPRQNKLFPFCSERCHLVDLGRWLGEDYRIPGPPVAPEALAAPADDD